jgi:hypothetical protein
MVAGQEPGARQAPAHVRLIKHADPSPRGDIIDLIDYRHVPARPGSSWSRYDRPRIETRPSQDLLDQMKLVPR